MRSKMASNAHGGRRAGAGRRPKPLADRKPRANGKLQVTIDPTREMVIVCDLETRALAQRLMLRFPDVPNVEALIALAVRRLAEIAGE